MLRILTAILLLFMHVGQAAAEPVGRIAIDPGHGGYDPGAMRGGIMEKDLNLEIAREVARVLKKNQVDVLLTRQGDYNHAILGLHRKEAKRYDFQRRAEMAKQFGADAMVSIHVNVGPGKCIGPEAYFYGKSAQGKLLAECIQQELHQIPEIRKRTIKTGRYYLLTHTCMPCVIVETGFINNPAERKKLLDKKYQQVLAEAICQGILEYLKTKDSIPKEKNVLDSFFFNIQKKVS